MRSIKRNIIWSALLPMLVLSTSCSPSELSSKELIDWVHNPDNGLVKEKVLGDIGFKVKYKPQDYLVAMELRESQLTDSNYQSTREKYLDLHYINLTIFPANNSQEDLLNYNTVSIQEHQEKIYYYSFPFQQDIYMIQGADTLPCVLFNFSRDHGLSPELNFALAFENKENKGDVQVVINDVVFGNGTLNFIIKEKDLKGFPSLKI